MAKKEEQKPAVECLLHFQQKTRFFIGAVVVPSFLVIFASVIIPIFIWVVKVESRLTKIQAMLTPSKLIAIKDSTGTKKTLPPAQEKEQITQVLEARIGK